MDCSLARKNITPTQYQQEYLGKWVVQCAVHNNKGKHCPDKPVHYIEFNSKRVGLCERCYQNYLNGAFNKERAKRIAVETAHNIPSAPCEHTKVVVSDNGKHWQCSACKEILS